MEAMHELIDKRRALARIREPVEIVGAGLYFREPLRQLHKPAHWCGSNVAWSTISTHAACDSRMLSMTRS
jgi:hypothetical protein